MNTLSGARLVLEHSRILRLTTLLLFYFTQGMPIGLFLYALPAWMAANGATAADTAWVVGTTMLPWSLKLVNGFILDRYTYLPMGRRRAWIVGAQSTIVLALIIGAIVEPAPLDLVILATIGFCTNVAITVQDVGIDSLAVDIMPEDERAKASGIMFGAQILGISLTTILMGVLLEDHGYSVALIVAAGGPLLVVLFGLAILERDGERRLPWGVGQAHPRNQAIQVEAWWPLLKQTFFAVIAPLSLLLLPILLLRALPYGAFEAFHPVWATQELGWSISEYTDLVGSAGLAAGVAGLFLGGLIVDKVGAQRSFVIFAGISAALYAAMALSPERWSDPQFFTVIVYSFEFAALFVSIAMLPIAMRLCSPALAATQFTLFMAVANFGRPLGAVMAGYTAGAGNPVMLYWCAMAVYVVLVGFAAFSRFPKGNRAQAEVAQEIAPADGIAPRVD